MQVLLVLNLIGRFLAWSELKCMQALQGLLADAEQLAGSIHSTAELSERVSKVQSCF